MPGPVGVIVTTLHLWGMHGLATRAACLANRVQ